jgi:hypothetical protein
MKRLVRSRIDPLPRSLSTKSLALLVAMLLSPVEPWDALICTSRAVKPSVRSPFRMCFRMAHRKNREDNHWLPASPELQAYLACLKVRTKDVLSLDWKPDAPIPATTFDPNAFAAGSPAAAPRP